ncbi:hypothetical protein BJX70DRAFT_377502, partial [Aspergillus crustosus]
MLGNQRSATFASLPHRYTKRRVNVLLSGNRCKGTKCEAVEELPAKEHLVSGRHELDGHCGHGNQQSAEHRPFPPEGIGDLAGAEGAHDSRGDRAAIECRLPFRVEDPVAIVEAAKVLTKLGDTRDVSGSLVLEADEEDTPDGGNTLGEDPGILFQAIPFGQLVVLLVGGI